MPPPPPPLHVMVNAVQRQSSSSTSLHFFLLLLFFSSFIFSVFFVLARFSSQLLFFSEWKDRRRTPTREIADNREPRQRPNPEGLGLTSDIVQRLSDYGTTTRQTGFSRLSKSKVNQSVVREGGCSSIKVAVVVRNRITRGFIEIARTICFKREKKRKKISTLLVYTRWSRICFPGICR